MTPLVIHILSMPESEVRRQDKELKKRLRMLKREGIIVSLEEYRKVLMALRAIEEASHRRSSGSKVSKETKESSLYCLPDGQEGYTVVQTKPKGRLRVVRGGR